MKRILALIFIVTFAEAQFSNDAIVLTLRTQQSIWLDTALAIRVDSGLSAARRVCDTLNSISVHPDYVLGWLSVKTTAA